MTDNLFWTRESVFCTCGHHVEDHKTSHQLLDNFGTNTPVTFCDFGDKDKVPKCGCKGFKAYK